MKKEDDPAGVKFNNVLVEDLIDSKKECDPKKILENKDNFIFNDYDILEIKVKDLLLKAPSKKNAIYDSDESLEVLQDRERAILRKCKVWRRRNNKVIEYKKMKQKVEDKMFIPNPVIENIETNEFELCNFMDEANQFIKGKYLVFYKNEREHKLINHNENQNRLTEIKKHIDDINNKFMEIDSKWEETSIKEDILVIHDDIFTLRKKSLDILEQKDIIINTLVKELEEKLSKLLIETEVNSSDLVELNKIAKNKIKTLKEEHNKYNLFLTKLIKEETTKKIDKDTAEWTLLMDKIIVKITSSACKRLSLIEEKNNDYIEQLETNEEKTKNLRIALAEKNIGMDADLELVKMKCSNNIIEKLQHNCHVLKKRIEENTFTMINQRRRMFLLQETAYKMNEKYTQIESACKAKIPIIKKQIININKRIDQQEKRADFIAKRDNSVYIRLWDLHLNNITSCINNILQFDYFFREFLNINGKQFLCEKPNQPIIDTLSYLDFIDNQLVFQLPTNSTSNSYELIRDKAFYKLLLNFIVKNSNFVFDNDLNEILDKNPMQNLPYVYNALNALKLNTKETIDLIKCKLKPFVVCTVCNSQINWNLNADLEQENCLNESENSCKNKIELTKSLFEKLSKHITQHNENIEKVKLSESQLLNEFNDLIINEEHDHDNCRVNTSIDNNIASIHTQCKNVNHELHIDNKYFMPIIKEIIKEKQSMPTVKPKSLSQRLQKEYDFIQWKISEHDLQTYWSQFTKYLPNSVNLWNNFYKAIRRYHQILVDRQKKMLKNKALQKENQKLKQFEHQIERFCDSNL